MKDGFFVFNCSLCYNSYRIFISKALYTIAETYLAENTMTRPALNIGHRGCPGGTIPKTRWKGQWKPTKRVPMPLNLIFT